MHTYQQTSHFTEPIVEPKIGQNRIKNIQKTKNKKQMTKTERNKKIIEYDKKNWINEWEWKNGLNYKNDDNIMILR